MIEGFVLAVIEDRERDSAASRVNAGKRPAAESLMLNSGSLLEPRCLPDGSDGQALANIIIGAAPIEFRVGQRGITERTDITGTALQAVTEGRAQLVESV